MSLQKLLNIFVPPPSSRKENTLLLHPPGQNSSKYIVPPPSSRKEITLLSKTIEGWKSAISYVNIHHCGLMFTVIQIGRLVLESAQIKRTKSDYE